MIASPKWPDKYEPNDFLGEGKCKWEIWAAPTKEIELNFMDVDIMDPNACLQEYYLVIKGKNLQVSLSTSLQFASHLILAF